LAFRQAVVNYRRLCRREAEPLIDLEAQRKAKGFRKGVGKAASPMRGDEKKAEDKDGLTDKFATADPGWRHPFNQFL
jgi:hypothetical protein